MNNIILLIIGYFIGSIQPAFIIGKLKGIDIRDTGSKNAGASNVTVTFGLKFGVITGLIDIFKAIIPIVMIRWIFSQDTSLYFVIGFAVIIGHIFPFYMGFKGGKGTASFLGMLLAINPLLGLGIVIGFVAVGLVSNYIALATYVMMIVTPVLVWALDYSFISIILISCISGISLYKHFPNMVKITKGTESKVRSSLKK